MTVIAIIAILAGLILGISGYATRKADRGRTVAQMEKLKNALEEYRLQYGSYPNLNGPLTNETVQFQTLRNRLTNTMQNADRELLFVDPWGNGYDYQRQSQFSYRIKSWGPDRVDDSDNIDSQTGGM